MDDSSESFRFLVRNCWLEIISGDPTEVFEATQNNRRGLGRRNNYLLTPINGHHHMMKNPCLGIPSLLIPGFLFCGFTWDKETGLSGFKMFLRRMLPTAVVSEMFTKKLKFHEFCK